MKKILCALLLISCAGCSSMLQRKELVVLTESEKEFALQSAKEIGLDFSYDFDSDIYGFYASGAAPAVTDARKNEDEKKVSLLLEKNDKAMLEPFYGKIYESYYSALFLKRYYEKRKNWSGYNYIIKTILPGTEYYLYISELALKKKLPDVKINLDLRKESIKKKAVVSQMQKLSVTDEF